MKGFFRFMAGSSGRLVRIIAGVALISWGYNYTGGINWWPIIIGLVPLSAGIFDFCVFAPLFGYPFSGKQLRALM